MGRHSAPNHSVGSFAWVPLNFLARSTLALLIWVGSGGIARAHGDDESQQNIGLILIIFFGTLSWLLFMVHRLIRREASNHNRRRRAKGSSRCWRIPK